MAWTLDDSRPIWPQLSQQLARQIIAGVQLEQENLAKADRTAGRLVTQDVAALEAARLREAEAVIRDYFEAMAALGYTGEQAVQLLKEEFQ